MACFKKLLFKVVLPQFPILNPTSIHHTTQGWYLKKMCDMCSNEQHEIRCRTLAQALDCDPKASSSEILKCLRNVDPIQTSRTALDLFKHYIVLPNPFKPHLDNTTSDPFFPRDPLEMIEDGEFQKVPTIYGYNEFDNLLFSAQYRINNHLFQDTKNRWHEIASVFMFQR